MKTDVISNLGLQERASRHHRVDPARIGLWLATFILIAFPLLSFALSPNLLIAPTGEASEDVYGGSVAVIGDLNGDGHADFVVSARRNSAGGSLAGRVYVYYGGPGIDETPDLILTGHVPEDRFGDPVGPVPSLVEKGKWRRLRVLANTRPGWARGDLRHEAG